MPAEQVVPQALVDAALENGTTLDSIRINEGQARAILAAVLPLHRDQVLAGVREALTKRFDDERKDALKREEGFRETHPEEWAASEAGAAQAFAEAIETVATLSPEVAEETGAPMEEATEEDTGQKCVCGHGEDDHSYLGGSDCEIPGCGCLRDCPNAQPETRKRPSDYIRCEGNGLYQSGGDVRQCPGCPDCNPVEKEVSTEKASGEMPTTHEVEDLLDDLEGEVTNCRGALSEDPGCLDPDRTMVAFEQLDGAARRFRKRLFPTTTPKPSDLSTSTDGGPEPEAGSVDAEGLRITDEMVERAARTLWTMRTESAEDLWAEVELHGDERAMYRTEARLTLAAALTPEQSHTEEGNRA